MTDQYHDRRWSRERARSKVDRAVFIALRQESRLGGPPPTSRSLVTAATTFLAGEPIGVRRITESLKRQEKRGLVARVGLFRTYKTRPPRLYPAPGWRIP